jgi:hypothetical protein
VLAAILSGAYTDEVASSSTSSNLTSPFAPFTAQEANALFTTTSGTSPSLTARTASTSTGQGPLENVGDLVGRWNKALGTLANGFSGPSADLTNIYSQALNSGGLTPTEIQTIQYVDRFHEAFLRPLAAVGNTRVWNLMIDVIAQTGRYPTGTSNPASFVVDGEQRYWVHVAIDRFTGQVLDKQVELVKE